LVKRSRNHRICRWFPGKRGTNRLDEIRETEALNCEGGSQEQDNAWLEASNVCSGWVEITGFREGSQACDCVNRQDEISKMEVPNCDGGSQEKDNAWLEEMNVCW
jgi:hypothetical protein